MHHLPIAWHAMPQGLQQLLRPGTRKLAWQAPHGCCIHMHSTAHCTGWDEISSHRIESKRGRPLVTGLQRLQPAQDRRKINLGVSAKWWNICFYQQAHHAGGHASTTCQILTTRWSLPLSLSVTTCSVLTVLLNSIGSLRGKRGHC